MLKAQGPEASRYIAREIFIINEDSSEFIARLDTTVKAVVRVELVDYKITGVPTTAGAPNYEYFRLDASSMGSDSISNDGQSSGLVLHLNGARTFVTYSPARPIADREVPVQLKEVNIRLTKPDGQRALIGTDYTGIYLTFKVTQDRNLPELR